MRIMLRHRTALFIGSLLCLPLVAPVTAAQEADPQIRTGARVADPPSGQNIRVLVHRAFIEPERNYDLNRPYRGRVRNHPVHRLLRMGERRLEHCIDSAPHSVLGVGQDGPNTVIRARLTFRGRRVLRIHMSDHDLSPLVERCLRAGFEQSRGQLPRAGRVIATIHLRPRE